MSERYSSGNRRRERADENRGRRGGRPIPKAKSGSASDLRTLLRSIDHRGYPAYKELTGQFDFGNYRLSIDHVQGDPFAAPSALSIHIDGKAAGFPEKMWNTSGNRRALTDHLIRLFEKEIGKYSHRAGGSGKSGLITCSHPGQEILERSACQINPMNGNLVFRFFVGFPAAGRTVLADNLERILFSFLPECAKHSLFFANIDREKARSVIDLAEDQAYLRSEMKKRGLIAFIADGSILPRESGVSERPMRGAVPFISPNEDAVDISLPHKGTVRGMGIPEGITLIIGGGYHGKSTLLQAVERGVYDHIAGGGREYVATDSTAVKIRAEDGRYIAGDDISPFIRNLPTGADTRAFSSMDGSGSTSQAASVTEAIESGARVLLMDEDTCATNFMVRDELMQRIVAQEEEPIIPFSLTMRPLFLGHGVSTILVAGSSGAFFGAADRILQMKEYRPKDVTEQVRGIVREDAPEVREPFHAFHFSARKPEAGGGLSDPDGRNKVKSLGRDGFMVNRETVDLRCVEQIVDAEQTECLAHILLALAKEMDGGTSLQTLIGGLDGRIMRQGFDALFSGRVPGDLAMPRVQEVYAAVNRCRAVRFHT